MKLNPQKLARITDQLSRFLILVCCIMGLVCGCASSETADQHPGQTDESDIQFGDQKIPLVKFVMPGSGKKFYVGKYEVTNDQYLVFLNASGYDGSDHPSSKPAEPFFYNWRKDKKYIDRLNGVPQGEGNYPACYLNWYHAKAFCDWLSKETGKTVRLPTAEEWKFVAAGKENRQYPWGNQWDPKRCNWAGDTDGFAGSAPIGSFPNGATPEGVCDMVGNIWEWSNDKTLMGGPWCLEPEHLTTQISADEDEHQANDKFGFRILVEAD